MLGAGLQLFSVTPLPRRAPQSRTEASSLPPTAAKRRSLSSCQPGGARSYQAEPSSDASLTRLARATPLPLTAPSTGHSAEAAIVAHRRLTSFRFCPAARGPPQASSSTSTSTGSAAMTALYRHLAPIGPHRPTEFRHHPGASYWLQQQPASHCRHFIRRLCAQLWSGSQ